MELGVSSPGYSAPLGPFARGRNAALGKVQYRKIKRIVCITLQNFVTTLKGWHGVVEGI